MTFPRWVHKHGGLTFLVCDAQDYTAALADGWSGEPVPMTLTKGDETTVLYTADALRWALAYGWAFPSVASVPSAKSKKGAK